MRSGPTEYAVIAGWGLLVASTFIPVTIFVAHTFAYHTPSIWIVAFAAAGNIVGAGLILRFSSIRPAARPSPLMHRVTWGVLAGAIMAALMGLTANVLITAADPVQSLPFWMPPITISLIIAHRALCAISQRKTPPE